MGQRSSVYELPPAVRAEVERRLTDAGFGGYQKLATELQARGFSVTKSALHRFGQKLEERVKLAAAAHLVLDSRLQALADEQREEMRRQFESMQKKLGAKDQNQK